MNTEERKLRIIARGEHSNHSHVITGDCTIRNEDGKIYVDVFTDGEVILKHLLESEWMKGNEVWTKEHTEIPLQKGTYEFIQQVEYDPYEDAVREVID